MSIRAYAERRGCTPETVRQRIKRAVLVRSVVWVPGKGGKDEPRIADPNLADQEWSAGTRPKAASQAATAASDEYSRLRLEREEENLRAARAKREAEELALAARRGELVPAAEIEAALAEEYTAVRTKLLALPTRAKQRLTHLTTADVAVLEDLVREALGELADDAGDVAA